MPTLGQPELAGKVDGSIDIGGRHDLVYRDALEMTGQVRAQLSQAMPRRRLCESGGEPRGGSHLASCQ
jgi:hypothetical protein